MAEAGIASACGKTAKGVAAISWLFNGPVCRGALRCLFLSY